MKKLLLISFLFLWANTSSKAQVIFSMVVEKDSMGIAEENTLKFRLEHPNDVDIRSIDLNPLQSDPVEQLITSTADTTGKGMTPEQGEEYINLMKNFIYNSGISTQVIDIKDAGTWKLNPDLIIAGDDSKWNTSSSSFGVVKENTIKFTCFEYGETIIFAPEIEYEENGEIKVTKIEPTGVRVIDPLAATTAAIDSLTVEPNIAIIEEPIDLKEDVLIPIGLFLLAAGLLGLIVWLILRKKEVEVQTIPRPKEIIPASLIANEKLRKLRQEKIWEQGQVKEYQSELTYVIREYLENRYKINALENTTFQIAQDLKELNLKESLTTDLKNILQVADLVKFAKAQPDQNIHEEFLTKAEQFVDTTKKTTAQIEQEKATQEAEYQKALETLNKPDKK